MNRSNTKTTMAKITRAMPIQNHFPLVSRNDQMFQTPITRAKPQMKNVLIKDQPFNDAWNSRHSPALMPEVSWLTSSPASIRRKADIAGPESCAAFKR